MAERFLYLPLIGFVWALAALAAAVVSKLRPGRSGVPPLPFVGFGVAAALAFAILTHVRNIDWQTELSFWQAAVRDAPRSFKTHANLADTLMRTDPTERGTDAAIAEAEKSLAIIDRPEVQDFADRRENSMFSELGRYYQAKADFRRAAGDAVGAALYLAKTIAILQRAEAVDRWINEESRRVRLARGESPGKIRPIHDQSIFHGLAVAQLESGRLADAIPNAIAAVTFDPFNAAGFEFLAACEIRLRRIDAARFGLYLAILANPSFSSAWDELGQVYARFSPGAGPIWHGTGDGRTLDADNPAVRPALLEACRSYDRLLRTQGFPERADEFRAFALRAFHFSPSDLTWPSSNLDPLAPFTRS